MGVCGGGCNVEGVWCRDEVEGVRWECEVT